MDLLFRLSKKVDGFSNIKETKAFFENELPNRDYNYFYDVKTNQQLEKGDTIYFVYDGYIVATAIFQGDIIKNLERDEEYKKYFYGHKVDNIHIIDAARKLNTSIVSTRTKYIDSPAIREEVNAVLNINSDNWTTAELEAAVAAYIDMRQKDANEEPYIKKAYYIDLTNRFGRSEKSYEYRMQNISYIYSLLGRDWLSGLKPARNVGARVAGELEALINKLEGQKSTPVAKFESTIKVLREKKSKSKPSGNTNPKKSSIEVTQYNRDPAVVAWLLNEANGTCENCDCDAPFVKEDGIPFLEVHHLRRLADGGSDTINNAIAVCPNCHRELHYGINRVSILKELYLKIDRLVDE